MKRHIVTYAWFAKTEGEFVPIKKSTVWECDRCHYEMTITESVKQPENWAGVIMFVPPMEQYTTIPEPHPILCNYCDGDLHTFMNPSDQEAERLAARHDEPGIEPEPSPRATPIAARPVSDSPQA